MAKQITLSTIQLKRGLSTSWTAKNPILQAGEPGLEIDTYRLKIGDGLTSWTNLPYTNSDLIDQAIANLVDSAPEALNTLKELADNFEGVATQDWVNEELQSYMPIATLPTDTNKKFNYVLNLNSDAIATYSWEEQTNSGSHFLSIWNAATGLPTVNPTVTPYTYKVGDYYRVGTVGGAVRYSHAVHMEGIVQGHGDTDVYNIDFALVTNNAEPLETFNSIAEYLTAEAYINRNSLTASGTITVNEISQTVGGISYEASGNAIMLNATDTITALAQANSAVTITDTVTQASTGNSYKPNGATYTGAASTIVDNNIETGDVYYYDGSTWLLEAKGQSAEALPEGTEAGQALIYNGAEWSKQNGYGYELAPETNINFDGDTDGLTEIATAFFPFYKLDYDGYLPTSEDLMGQTVYYKYNGDLETSEWNADDVQMSPEGTLELMKDNFADTMIIVYDDTTMSKYDDGLFTKGIWVAKQDDNNYIMDIYFGPVVNQIDSKFIPSDDNKANVDAVVNLTEDQIIGGEKEFTSPIKFESGLSTTSYGQGGVTIGAFAQPTTKYNFATDGSDYVTDGEVTVASREWVEAQGYQTSSGETYTAGDGIEISDDNVISATNDFTVESVTLTGTSGTLTADELSLLNNNQLNYITLDGKQYKFNRAVVGRSGIVATYTTQLDPDQLSSGVIDLQVLNGAWNYRVSKVTSAYSAGSNISIVDNVISATVGDSTMGRSFTTNVACGYLASGSTIAATDTIADILYRILYQAPATTLEFYYGGLISVPTAESDITTILPKLTKDTEFTKENLISGITLNLIDTNNKEDDYLHPVLVVTKPIELSTSGWKSQFNSPYSDVADKITIGDYNIYYRTSEVDMSVPETINLKFKEAV